MYSNYALILCVYNKMSRANNRWVADLLCGCHILCPAVDSPVMWKFDGQKFQQKQTEATMYDLVGNVATYMFFVEDQLKEGMRLDVLNRIEGLTAYLKTVEDVSYCQSCEHCDFDFQELSLQFRAALDEHFKHIKGVQFLQADVQQ